MQAPIFITTTAMILVLLAYPITHSWLAILLVLIVVLRDILISGVRMVAANKNLVIPADIFGKIKSFILDTASMVLMLYIGLANCVASAWVGYIRIVGLVLMIIGVVLCVISCINYIVNAIKTLSNKENS